MSTLQTAITRSCILLVLLGSLAACGGGGGGSDGGGSGQPDTPPVAGDGDQPPADDGGDDDQGGGDPPGIVATFGGSVGDGPITGATVEIRDVLGNLVGSVESDASANYTVDIDVDASLYPLTISATGGIDLVSGGEPEFTLYSVVLDPVAGVQQTVNINPFSSLIVKTAELMPGGLASVNVAAVTQTLLDEFSFGLDATLVADPVYTAIDEGSNAAMVKASEAFAEWIRRTTTALQVPEPALDEDTLLLRLAADLSDGMLDGDGGEGASPTLAATAFLTAGEVACEATSNALEVGGAVATAAMDQAIVTVTGSPTALTGDVPITGGLLVQAAAAVDGALYLVSDQSLNELSDGLQSISPGSLAEDVQAAVPATLCDSFDGPVALVPFTSDTSLRGLIEVVTSAQNTPPTIGGLPPSKAMQGSVYTFAPTASDEDGDLLVFTISNRPAWASFDGSSGILTGMPGTNDVGTTSGIVISVSDGEASASLPPFEIEVAQDNRAPELTGVPPLTVEQGARYEFVPFASDADGDELIFSVSSQPAWTSFDPATGALTGEPGDADVGLYPGIIISATDGVATVSLPPFGIDVLDVNEPPAISGTPLPVVTAGTPYFFSPTAVDPDGDPLSFTIENQPLWSVFEFTTGVLTGTPDASDVDSYADIVIAVSDGSLTTALPAFAITVVPPGIPPSISGSPATSVLQGEGYEFVPTASSAIGDTLLFSISNQPSWAAFEPTTGTLTGTPDNGDVGTTAGIVISVSDAGGSASLNPFDLTVVDVNDPPGISGTPDRTVLQDQPYEFVPTGTDADGDAIVFSIANQPPWAAFDAASGALTGTPDSGDVGIYPDIVISVSDGSDATSLEAFGIIVVNVNDAPAIGGTPATSIAEGQLYRFEPEASDADGDVLVFGITNQPAWTDFDTVTGVLSGTPGSGDVGTVSGIVISVSDGLESASLPAFSISVTSTNSAPAISGNPLTTVVAGEQYAFVPEASDPDGDPLAFNIVNKPSWASFDTATGALTGTPDASDIGTSSNIAIIVSDGQAIAALPPFSVTVVGANGAPTISGTPPTAVNAGEIYVFTPAASDPDGDPLTFSIANKPGWASFSASTGTLGGTPSANDLGTTDGIVISVSDGEASASLPAFSVTVVAVNGAPTISGTPPTAVNAGEIYAFTPAASDPDGDPLTFSIANKPGWASFSASTGTLGGTPSANDLGTTDGIVISVSDGEESASLPAFAVTVTASNSAPTISGTPPTTVAVGVPYAFTPSADDPDGDTLTFGIVNKPAWASFSASTGTLSGTPDAADVGTTSGIVISVSDSEESDALAAFSITVTGGDGLAISNTAPAAYEWGILVPGADVYIDRNYSYDSIPVAYVGFDYLRTANDDRAAFGADFVTFQVDQAVTVYVAVSGSQPPSWLGDWTATGDTFGTTDRDLSVYQRDFAAGQIGLGANEDGPSMYTVAVAQKGVPGVPIAVPDAAQTAEDESVTIDVLANDFGLEDAPLTVDILSEPASGAAQVQADLTVLYTPAPGFFGQDSLVYEVTDADGDASSASVSVDVTEFVVPNNPPTISGTPPAEATAGETYSFVPDAIDPDGDPLSFNIGNKPAWASFDPATGALTGTPAGTDAGSFGGIVITVSDGEDTASLPAFSIDVVAAGSGSASLSWLPPTENADGTQLEDLAGYKIYYGTATRDYGTAIQVANPGLSTFVVDGLAIGTTYYFSVTAYDTSGNESGFSNEATKLIQ